jgi:hypothetical protein
MRVRPFADSKEAFSWWESGQYAASRKEKQTCSMTISSARCKAVRAFPAVVTPSGP